MTAERLDRIKDLVMRFREAAADPRVRDEHKGYANFPAGSCTWASFALGQLLAELEPGEDWHLVNAAAQDSWGGHDWLESHHLAVDVTADQFQGFVPYVGPAPAPLHPRYSGTKKRVELSNWDPPHEAALTAIRGVMKFQSGG